MKKIFAKLSLMVFVFFGTVLNTYACVPANIPSTPKGQYYIPFKTATDILGGSLSVNLGGTTQEFNVTLCGAVEVPRAVHIAYWFLVLCVLVAFFIAKKRLKKKH